MRRGWLVLGGRDAAGGGGGCAEAAWGGLFDYLGRLPAEQRRGVWPERLRLGVATRAEGYLEALRAAVQARLGGTRVHGRVVDLVPLTGGEADLLAIRQAEFIAGQMSKRNM